MSEAHEPTRRRALTTLTISAGAPAMSAAELRALCLEAGADDVGFVEIERGALAPDLADIVAVLPRTRTVIGLVRRMGVENVRSPMRSVANAEFHAATHDVQDVEREIVRRLERAGVRAAYAPPGFPMEAARFGAEKVWVVSHKVVAEQAGLGSMGIHRNVIHPRFGNFILLGTVFAEVTLDRYDAPLAESPCLGCKLCVAACPVGAIKSDGTFSWAVCATHNYREFLGGFIDWVDELTDAAGALGYHRRFEDHETVSMWQSLSFGPNYKAAYCLSVCPAGDDVIGPFLADKKEHLERVVRPLQEKEETVYVVAGGDAEAHVRKRFPRKRVKVVGSGMRPRSARAFVEALPWLFSTHGAGDLRAKYLFRFGGAETFTASVTIGDGGIGVNFAPGDRADVTIEADAASWVSFVRGEAGLVGLLLRRRVRVRGDLRLMRRFKRCFPT
ncbi:MAG: SCP2 sterol-binding domain-containing protein [Phycisphaerales bacterium]|nr:SCP2 sterol-binding domain-containing protein [Phycisphaerales bacterium]